MYPAEQVGVSNKAYHSTCFRYVVVCMGEEFTVEFFYSGHHGIDKCPDLRGGLISGGEVLLMLNTQDVIWSTSKCP